MSKVIRLNDAGTAATVEAATIGDVFSTLLSTDSALTGMLGLAQKVGLVVAGMAVQNHRLGRGLNFISAA